MPRPPLHESGPMTPEEGGMRVRLTQADYDAIPKSLKSWCTRPDGTRVRVTADSHLEAGVWSTVLREVEIID